jgi:hypothetical protein
LGFFNIALNSALACDGEVPAGIAVPSGLVGFGFGLGWVEVDGGGLVRVAIEGIVVGVGFAEVPAEEGVDEYNEGDGIAMVFGMVTMCGWCRCCGGMDGTDGGSIVGLITWGCDMCLRMRWEGVVLMASCLREELPQEIWAGFMVWVGKSGSCWKRVLGGCWVFTKGMVAEDGMALVGILAVGGFS